MLNIHWDRLGGIAYHWSDDRLAEAVAQIARTGWARGRRGATPEQRAEVLAEAAARVSMRGLARGLGDGHYSEDVAAPEPADYRGDHR